MGAEREIRMMGAFLGKLFVTQNQINLKNFHEHPIREFSRLTPSLYVGAYKDINDETVRRYQINLIVNATRSKPIYQPKQIDLKSKVHVVRVPLNDHQEDIFPYLKHTADLIMENAKLGGKTLVHCVQGKSRSVSLCIAYLILYDRSENNSIFEMNVENALDFVQEKRSFAQPNRLFMQQLQCFHDIVSKARSDAANDTCFVLFLESKLKAIDVSIDKLINETDKEE